MAYQANKPQPNDQISQSQQDLLNNFIEINNFVNVDHGPFNGSLEGMHVKVTLPRGTNPPTNPFTADATGFYCAFGLTATTIRQTYIHNTLAAGTQIDVPFSESIMCTQVAPTQSAGWTYLPSGILMKWGQATTINGFLSINLNAGGDLGPNFTQAFNAQVSLQSPLSTLTGIPRISALTAGNLAIQSTDANKIFMWMVIGRGV